MNGVPLDDPRGVPVDGPYVVGLDLAKDADVTVRLVWRVDGVPAAGHGGSVGAVAWAGPAGSRGKGAVTRA